MIFPVYLVGAGPGDPELITVRGKAALDAAEVVIADRLVSPALIPTRGGVEVHVRGERRSALSQEEINRLMVERARAGKRVVRLKGGDPFVFGRGGEEAEALRAAGVPYVVVPGITAAIAAPAYAGIPVTHREVAGAVAFVTGHEADDKASGGVDWHGLAGGATTLVLYMSVTHLDAVAAKIIAAGRAPSTPAAVIERGTLPGQRVIVGTLGDIAHKAREAQIEPPALTIVGEVVALRESMAWFEESARQSPRVLVLGGDGERAARPGAGVVHGAPLTVVPRRGSLAKEIADLARYRWLALTSANAVDALMDELGAAGKDLRALGGVRIAALAGGTTERLVEFALRPDVHAEGGGADLARALLAAPAPHGPALFPRALGGRHELPDTLEAAGVEVRVIDAYATRVNEDEVRRLLAEHRASPFGAIGFASPRGAAALLDWRPNLDGVLIGAIGKTTATWLRERGLDVQVVASKPSLVVLEAELVTALAAKIQIG